MLRFSIVRCQNRGLAMLPRSSEELDNVMEADDAGGRTADEQLHQTLLRSHQKMPNSRRQLCRALDTLACFGRWRTLTIYLGISLYDGQLDVVLICHRLAKLGIDQLLTCASLCWRTRRLSLLSPPLRYAQLDLKSYTDARPLKNYDRATISHGCPRAGQRFWVSLGLPNSTAFTPSKRGRTRMDSTPRTGSTRTGSSSGLDGGLAQRAGKAGD